MGSVANGSMIQPFPRHFVARGTQLTPQAAEGGSTLYLLEEGRALYIHTTPDGRETSTGILGPGEVFVYRRPELPNSPGAHLVALEDVRLLVVGDRHLEELAHVAPDLATRLMRALVARCEDLNDHVSDLSLADVRRRVLRVLLLLADRHAIDDGEFRRIVPALKHQDVAELVGACRETVTAALGELAREGIVRTGRCTLWVEPARARSAMGT